MELPGELGRRDLLLLHHSDRLLLLLVLVVLEAGAVVHLGLQLRPLADREAARGLDGAGVGADEAAVLPSVGEGGVEHVHGDEAKLAGRVDPGA